METKENTTVKEVSPPPPPPAPQLDPKIPTPPPLTAAPSIIAQNKNNHPNLFLKTSPFQSFGSGHFLPSESVYESAAKLLFMSIKWARSVPSFLQLNDSDQTLLLEDSWAQLFVIGLAQWSIQFDEGDFSNQSRFHLFTAEAKDRAPRRFSQICDQSQNSISLCE